MPDAVATDADVESADSGAKPSLKARASARWAAAKAAHPSLRHVVAAWKLAQDNHGNQFAAAITYFSFLALFPLLLLAVAITGFVLHAHPEAMQSLFTNITKNVPGELGQTLNTSIKTAIDKRAGVGIVGLVGVLLTGLGWIGNLRAAIDAVWGLRPPSRNFVIAKLLNLMVLAGLGLGMVISLGISVVGTAATDQVLGALNLDHVAGVRWLVKGLGLLLGLVGDFIIFWWLLVRLPKVSVPPRVGLKGATLAAVGFSVLKIAGTYTIAHAAQSPTAGPFASLLAVLIWIQLVARFLLFVAAWMAVLTRDERPAEFAEGPQPGELGTYIARVPREVGWRDVAGYVAGGAVVGALLARRGGPRS